MKLPTLAITTLCNIYNADLEVFEKIKLVDNILYPKMLEAARDKKEPDGTENTN